MGEEKERKGGERKKEGAGTDERPGKSGCGERNKKERRERKRKTGVDSHQMYGVYANKNFCSSEGYQKRKTF